MSALARTGQQANVLEKMNYSEENKSMFRPFYCLADQNESQKHLSVLALGSNPEAQAQEHKCATNGLLFYQTRLRDAHNTQRS